MKQLQRRKTPSSQRIHSRSVCSRSSASTTFHTEIFFQLPPEPDNCCMSGCANCVWIQYAKDLTDLYQDSGGTAKQIILEKIKDPTMQVFIKMELTSLNHKKQFKLMNKVFRDFHLNSSLNHFVERFLIAIGFLVKYEQKLVKCFFVNFQHLIVSVQVDHQNTQNL